MDAPLHGVLYGDCTRRYIVQVKEKSSRSVGQPPTKDAPGRAGESCAPPRWPKDAARHDRLSLGAYVLDESFINFDVAVK